MKCVADFYTEQLQPGRNALGLGFYNLKTRLCKSLLSLGSYAPSSAASNIFVKI